MINMVGADDMVLEQIWSTALKSGEMGYGSATDFSVRSGEVGQVLVGSVLLGGGSGSKCVVSVELVASGRARRCRWALKYLARVPWPGWPVPQLARFPVTRT